MFQRALIPAALGLLFGLLGTNALAANHTVTQTGFTFVPSDLTIALGDTVDWVHTAGFHTVTEGTDDLNPPTPAKLFDTPLTAAVPMFSLTFTQLGDVPYFCRNHLLFGMTGIIRVTQPTPVPSPNESLAWARVKNLYR